MVLTSCFCLGHGLCLWSLNLLELHPVMSKTQECNSTVAAPAKVEEK